MATLESIAIRCDAALDAIEAACGKEAGSIPRLHRNREMLRALQLEAIAGWLNEAQAESKPDGHTDNRRKKRDSSTRRR